MDFFQDKLEFTRRRRLVAHKMHPNSVMILPSLAPSKHALDGGYSFRQDSDLLYLTGIEQSDVFCLLYKEEAGNLTSFIFLKELTAEELTWVGPRLSPESADLQAQFDQVQTLTDLEHTLSQILAQVEFCYLTLGQDTAFEARLLAWASAATRTRGRLPHFIDRRPIFAEARLIKSSQEIACLRHIITQSALAHAHLMEMAPKTQHEFELEAAFRYFLARRACRRLAYPSIVGQGLNACILHYQRNDALLTESDLILVDAGGEWQGYCADITRTYPKNGVFTGPQKDVYDLVLKAQLAAIAIIKPGLAWCEIQNALLAVLVPGLIDLNLLQGDPETLIHDKAYRRYYMHSSGHWLGLDVHDVGAYTLDGQSRLLKPGMVLTIEPGLYLGAQAPHLWQGIGVRIEDDILVTETACEVLSGHAPKERTEIEARMRYGHI